MSMNKVQISNQLVDTVYGKDYFSRPSWSPDGLQLLVQTTKKMLIYTDGNVVGSQDTIPNTTGDINENIVNETTVLDSMDTDKADTIPYQTINNKPVGLNRNYKPTQIWKNNEDIYDYAWYPHMKTTDPSTCCFLTTKRDHPIHLLDSNTGALRCTYKSKDGADEITAPMCVRFNLYGDKVYAGYDNCVDVFDVYGELEMRVKCTPSRAHPDGLKGVISTIDFNTDQSGMYAMGTFSGNIGIADERNNELLVTMRDPENKAGNQQGLSQVEFSKDGRYLYSSSRNSGSIACWDIRQSGEVLYRIKRKGETNQRIMFGLNHEYLVTGDTEGRVYVVDVQGEGVNGIGRELVGSGMNGIDGIGDPVCMNGSKISSEGILVTTSGERQFLDEEHGGSIQIWDLGDLTRL
ncbi:hypothetical protein HDV02_004078 [Globomyces sp. JEL0801]|nr:hypothetical protein HDV02_004078 [Globomyces sp. JEL0801]